jgi:hypothetical protein
MFATRSYSIFTAKRSRYFGVVSLSGVSRSQLHRKMAMLLSTHYMTLWAQLIISRLFLFALL